MKCNLDCSYCPAELYGGHDNSTQHPTLQQCFDTIDFMYQYADIYMSLKPKNLRFVILNVYGGESLYFPDIIEVLKNCRHKHQQHYQSKWKLIITTTTNAIVPKKKMQQIIGLVDEFTVSYHTEATNKQKQLFRENLLTIKAAGRRQKCIVLMHNDPAKFDDALQQIEWCRTNDIPVLPKQLDNQRRAEFRQPTAQAIWFKNLYQQRSYKVENKVKFKTYDDTVDLADSGRSCCGGRQMCQDSNFRQRHAYVDNRFPGWFCSVDEFFVYIKQVTGEVFTNKDCKTNFNGSIGPIGSLDAAQDLLDRTRQRLNDPNRSVIQCIRYRCLCGLCAPKAQDRLQFDKIMEKYRQ